MKSGFLLAFAIALAVPLFVQAADVSFNRDIRPILSENCFACHGLDAKQRKADLRLDVAANALAERDGNFAIKPGDLAKSEVWQRISSDDPAEVMPPPATKKKLKPEQKEIIRRWIEAGAPYEKHWAFEPPAKSAEPAVKNDGWAKNTVDHFILARLEREGLTPRPEAARTDVDSPRRLCLA